MCSVQVSYVSQFQLCLFQRPDNYIVWYKKYKSSTSVWFNTSSHYYYCVVRRTKRKKSKEKQYRCIQNAASLKIKSITSCYKVGTRRFNVTIVEKTQPEWGAEKGPDKETSTTKDFKKTTEAKCPLIPPAPGLYVHPYSLGVPAMGQRSLGHSSIYDAQMFHFILFNFQQLLKSKSSIVVS